MPSDGVLPSSFRDPSGFLFVHDGTLYRQVNAAYGEDYGHLMSSGLYDALVEAGHLVPHEEVGMELARTGSACKVLRPEPVPFISYPYEWCFGELRDAALTTLAIQKKALEFGMTLKDASAYNIQFLRGRPVCLDTLSFERYREGQVWVAYRQFCQHFLAPLALMARADIRLSQLARTYIDGVPLDLASALLPRRTWLKPSLLLHIHVHAKSQRRFADKQVEARGKTMSRLAFEGLVDSLEAAATRLRWEPKGTEWGDYYEDTNYTDGAAAHKRELVTRFVEAERPTTVWDLGANDGLFSRIASDRQIPTIAFDIDPACVEKNYRRCRTEGETHILPLLLDLTNPSPGIGWANRERMSLLERGPADMVLALALIHHLAISNNVPVPQIASFLSSLCTVLVIEFVPKEDSQVRRLLATREDIFPNYTREGFEAAFGEHFTIDEATQVRDQQRTLYLMRRKGDRA